MYELAETGRYDSGFQRFTNALTTAVDMAARAYDRDQKLSGLATGLRDLDKYMGGLQRSDLIIIAGRPGMGKTALATNIAYNIAHAFLPETRADGEIDAVDGGRVGFFSLEMSAEQLATRIISEQTEISSSTIRRGQITEADFEKIVAFARTIAGIAAVHRRNWRSLDCATICESATPQATTRAGSTGGRLYSAAPRLDSTRAGGARPRGDRNHHKSQSAGETTQHPDYRVVPAFAAS